MNLLIFAPFYPPHMGGLENYAKELHGELSKRKYQVTVFTPYLPRRGKQREFDGGVYIIRFPAFEIVANYPLPKIWLPLFWNSLKSAFAPRPDILISHTRFFITSLLALVIAKWKGLPLVHFEHGAYFVKLSSLSTTMLAKWYDFSLGRLVLRHSTINVSISKSVSKFVSIFDKRYSPVIYRGINTVFIDQVESGVKDTNKLTADKMVVITIGRLIQCKGIEYSIKAILSLPAEVKEKIVFLIIGDGEDYEYLKNMTEPPVYLIGMKSRRETMSLMKQADIYIHSSLPGGGLSSALLEAMYAGCAIIGTKDEGAGEILSHQYSALVVPTADAKAINRGVVKLFLDEVLRHSLAEGARKTIIEKISWSRSVAALEKIFIKAQQQ